VPRQEGTVARLYQLSHPGSLRNIYGTLEGLPAKGISLSVSEGVQEQAAATQP